jgi:hypothetical protein
VTGVDKSTRVDDGGCPLCYQRYPFRAATSRAYYGREDKTRGAARSQALSAKHERRTPDTQHSTFNVQRPMSYQSYSTRESDNTSTPRELPLLAKVVGSSRSLRTVSHNNVHSTSSTITVRLRIQEDHVGRILEMLISRLCTLSSLN